MKRQRPTTPISTIKPSTPSTPPTPQTLLHKTHQYMNTTISFPSKKTRKSLSSFSEHFKSSKTTAPSLISSDPKSLKWEPLNLGKSELFLPLTFPTGQTFRWKQTGPFQYTGVVNSHLLSLKQLDNGDGDVAYFFHQTTDEAEARAALDDFLNLGISLGDIWEVFSASDSRFAELALHLGGARVLRQDPLECLLQFLCSSNNNIGRITKMVDFISSLGDHLGTVEGFEFHEFPSLERLSLVSEAELREAGFGYSFNYAFVS
ncbi:hypothetical protein HHK36_007776 [Tetracentron sinense]|uniref:8-oxoguanine DNA glycosylase N-terminal domain-containing protein n=1 Tax=Tetracentron sinense TaxID=13715 RepID=A0A834ZDC1_TETSI|nr:hypothetical protein HHK36_007776 [Tetracentron sinense]